MKSNKHRISPLAARFDVTRCISLSVGCVCVAIGTVNTYKSVVGFAGQASLIALGIGLTVAVCEASAVEFAKRAKGLVRVGFIALFAASMLYIISNTLFVYYSAYNGQKIERETRNAAAIDENSVEMRRYNGELERYNAQRSAVTGEISLIDQTIGGIPADYITRRQELLDRREKAMATLNAFVVPEEPETTAMTTEHTAWELLARVFGIDPDALSMVFLALPAVIADIASPLFFCMFFGQKPVTETETDISGTVPVRIPRKRPEENRPSLAEVIGYIDNVMGKGYGLSPDDAVEGIDAQRCAELRQFLMSFMYKERPVISETDGRLVSIFDKENLKRFAALQYDVQRMNKEATDA
jgi:hypothetical protein